MDLIFYKDIKLGQEISYNQLISDLNSVTNYNKYCISTNYYIVFKNIILSILLGKEIILLDEDFSKDEIQQLTMREKTDESLFIENLNIKDLDDLFQRMENYSKYWKITLFTSGTTGIPKKISHNFSSITRAVKKNIKYSGCVWGYAYNPTHMAGVQVFFQSFFNRNKIVRIFKLDRKEILNEINLNKITHISATPTFYRLLLPSDTCCKSVLKLTSGGEKFDKKTFDSLSQMFPNAKITNVYASTEAGAILSSHGDLFEIKPEFSRFVKIKNNELYIHKEIIGEANFELEDLWYPTGDIVEIISNEPLKIIIINRKNNMINVGGYKVNPIEVEDAIRDILGVKEVLVYGKTNSLIGNIICADIVSNRELSEIEIRNVLKARLQEFKVPRIIKFVQNIEITRTGKLKRN